MWISVGFSMLGPMLGALVGLSSDSISKPVVLAMFSLIGGSLIAFLSKINGEDRILAGKLLTALCLSFVVSDVTGIYVNHHRLLSPNRQEAQETFKYKDDSYQRNSQLSYAKAIDANLTAGSITEAQAYQQMYKHSLELEEAAEPK